MNPVLQVLYIEDNQVNITLVRILLASSKSTKFEYLAVNSLADGLAALQGPAIDVVLLDLGLPDSVGLEGVQRILQAHPDICLVVLTGNQDKSLAMGALEIGAQDYLDKESLEADFLHKSLIFAYGRKQAERKIKAHEAELGKLSTAVKQSANTILITDHKGNIEFINPKFTELTGYTQEEVMGKNPSILRTDHQSDAFYKELWDIINGGNTWKGNFVNRKKNGDLFWESATISPIKNEAGEITNFIAIKEDITKEREISQKLKESNRQYTSLIGNIQGMVYRCKLDRSWAMDFVSQGCKELTGYEVEAFDKNPLLFGQLMVEDDADEVWQIVNFSIQKKEPFSINYRITDQMGRRRWVHDRGMAVYDNAGIVIYVEGIIYDITDRLVSQEMIINASMKTEIQERSRIAKEIHDGLQQTLTSSFLHFEAIRKEMDLIGGKTQSVFSNGYQLLNKGIEETRTIAHRLLPKVIEDYGLIEAIESMIKSIIDQELKIEFYHNFPADIQLDKNIELVVYRILQEATNNVLKYAKASKFTIQLFAYSNQIVLTLEDNGVGFSMKDLDQKNSGFGLMSMKSRADVVGGFLQIDSKIGNGTNIMATIPLST